MEIATLVQFMALVVTSAAFVKHIAIVDRADYLQRKIDGKLTLEEYRKETILDLLKIPKEERRGKVIDTITKYDLSTNSPEQSLGVSTLLHELQYVLGEVGGFTDIVYLLSEYSGKELIQKLEEHRNF